MEILKKYGADALRLYLINSPVVRAEPLRFREDGVFAVVKDVFLPWYNAYRFLVQNILRLEAESGARFYPTEVRKLSIFFFFLFLVFSFSSDYLSPPSSFTFLPFIPFPVSGCLTGGYSACPSTLSHSHTCGGSGSLVAAPTVLSGEANSVLTTFQLGFIVCGLSIVQHIIHSADARADSLASSSLDRDVGETGGRGKGRKEEGREGEGETERDEG